MTSPKDLTPVEIIARIEQEEGVAYGINDAELSADRAKAIEYYLGEPFGNEIEGRSQVVSYDVQDTIESALPQLLKVFVSGDKVVQFNPRGQEDEEAAEQETDYLNYVVMEKNSGFSVFYTWFKDALLSKNGYVKVWYEEEYETEEESYRGLTDGQLSMLVQDENVTVLEHTAYPDPVASQQRNQAIEQLQQNPQAMQQLQQVIPEPMLHDVKISISKAEGCIKIQNVAPESIMVSIETPGLSLQKSRFVQHRERTTISELKEQGFDIPDDVEYSDNDFFFQEANARDLYSESSGGNQAAELSEEVLVKDTYILINGKRKRYVVVGQKIILAEDCEIVPFSCISPILMPHRHIGRSYSDLTMDIQLIKSALIRGQLDNMYLANNSRTAISNKVSIEDMLVSRPGGIVRVDGTPASEIMPMGVTPLPAASFTMVEYLDNAKEKRTGITAQNQGLDSDSLNKTARGMNMLMTASMMRLETVARLFAETGVKELFLMTHRLIRKNYTKPEIIQLRNKWVEIDPRNWKTRKDMSIAVGLGTGNKDVQLGHLTTILTAQERALPLGIATPKNIYNALSKLTQNAGFKNAEEFWTDPGDQPLPQQPNPEVIKAQAEQQALQLKAQLQMQTEQHKQEMQHQQILAQNQMEAEKTMLELQQTAELEKLKQQHEMAIAMQKMELDKYKTDTDNATKLTIANIGTQPFIDKATESAIKPVIDGLKQMIAETHLNTIHTIGSIEEQLNQPKEIVRDDQGKVIGVKQGNKVVKIKRDGTGNIVGL